MSTLSERLITLRKKKNLTIAEVAKSIDVSPSTYRDWEYGREIQGEPYQKIAEVFGVSLSFLMTGRNSEDMILILDKLEKGLGDLQECVKYLRSQL